jgi:hypothetical protein
VVDHHEAVSRAGTRLTARKAPVSLAHLPAAIVAAVTALADDLDGWAIAHPDGNLQETETAVLTAVRTHLPVRLHAVLHRTQRSWAPAAVRCPDCHHAAPVRDWRPRQVLTLCGRLRWERPWATCDRCHHSFGAGDATLGLAPYQPRSPGVDAVLVTLGSTTAFREAAALLTETTGLRVSAETIRTVTEAAGARVAATQAAAAAQVGATGEPAAPLDVAPGTLVTETDGVMVRYQDGWHEVKLALVGGWPAAPPHGARRLQAVSYLAWRAEAGAFGRLWGAEAARRGALTVVGWHGRGNSIARLRPVVVIGDGAHWIWETAGAQFGERIEIVDYYHACEHLTPIAEALHGPQTPAARAWAADQRGVLLTRGVDAVLAALRSPGGLDARAQETVRRERAFFTTNRARMRYPAFRAQGLPIGSGAIESTAKHLIQLRMKRPGCRWSIAGGQALAALRAHRATQLGQAA